MRQGGVPAQLQGSYFKSEGCCKHCVHSVQPIDRLSYGVILLRSSTPMRYFMVRPLCLDSTVARIAVRTQGSRSRREQLFCFYTGCHWS